MLQVIFRYFLRQAGGFLKGVLSSGGGFNCMVLTTKKQLRELYKENHNYFWLD